MSKIIVQHLSPILHALKHDLFVYCDSNKTYPCFVASDTIFWIVATDCLSNTTNQFITITIFEKFVLHHTHNSHFHASKRRSNTLAPLQKLTHNYKCLKTYLSRMMKSILHFFCHLVSLDMLYRSCCHLLFDNRHHMCTALYCE